MRDTTRRPAGARARAAACAIAAACALPASAEAITLDRLLQWPLDSLLQLSVTPARDTAPAYRRAAAQSDA